MNKKRQFKFKDPMKTYEKPTSVEIKINGGNDFMLFEKVVSGIFDTMGFKKNGGEIEDDYVKFIFIPKNKRSK